MRFMPLKAENRGEMSVKQLNSGVNLRDALSCAKDTQLTEIYNMWYKQGLLRTRPGQSLANALEITLKKPENFDNVSHKTKLHKSVKVAGKVLLSHTLRFYNEEKTVGHTIYFFFTDENTVEPLAPIFIESDGQITFFVAEKEDILYCFLSNQSIMKLDLKEAGSEWQRVADSEYYIPLTFFSLKSDGKMMPSFNNVSHTGISAESYNLLGKYFKISYTAYNPDAEDGNGHIMSYPTPHFLNDEKYAGYTVTAEYTDKNGTKHTHSITLTGDASPELREASPAGDGLLMRVLGNTVQFLTYREETASYTFARITEENAKENNLILTLPYKNKEGLREKLFGMTCSEWFGGAVWGLSGGTRLFVCGNEADKALICYSGLNNPLYFPESANIYVGNHSTAVTGFGKQSDTLVIFKENEVWHTRYSTQNINSYDSESPYFLSEYLNSLAYFPLTLVNSSVGCKYPDTVALCRNRLVWAGSTGKVYTLVDQNQYNERSVFEVSQMISSRLANDSLENACATDYNGCYLLSADNYIYVLDYNSYGFINISGYMKSGDANQNIPWYIWKLGENEPSPLLISFENALLAVSFEEGQNGLKFKINRFKETSETDNGKPIKSYFKTALFDFSAPNRYKKINSLSLSLGTFSNKLLTLTLFADLSDSKTVILTEGSDDIRNPDFIKSRVVYPNISFAVKQGFALECEGGMCISGFNINYTLKGRVK